MSDNRHFGCGVVTISPSSGAKTVRCILRPVRLGFPHQLSHRHPTAIREPHRCFSRFYRMTRRCRGDTGRLCGQTSSFGRRRRSSQGPYSETETRSEQIENGAANGRRSSNRAPVLRAENVNALAVVSRDRYTQEPLTQSNRPRRRYPRSLNTRFDHRKPITARHYCPRIAASTPKAASCRSVL